jgi:hypothetical protein
MAKQIITLSLLWIHIIVQIKKIFIKLPSRPSRSIGTYINTNNDIICK